MDFNPRTAWAMRRSGLSSTLFSIVISIHAPHERCDGYQIPTDPMSALFQSTHRMSDATEFTSMSPEHIEISIHAPHERCDTNSNIPYTYTAHFNPRTAWAMRHLSGSWKEDKEWFQSTHRMSDATKYIGHSAQLIKFQSTHRMSDATGDADEISSWEKISIHAPHERCDSR